MQYLISFLEGIITFISPCLLPMLPIYISYFAGGGERSSVKTLKSILGFIFGFTAVFVALGALAGTLGGFMQSHKAAVNALTGAAVIIFGLSYIGVFRLKIFKGIKNPLAGKDLGFFSALLFGVIFSVGWTPCVGTFLGSALLLASQQGSALKGVLLLLTYSLGLGVPFAASAFLIDRMKGAFSWIKQHYKAINTVCGVLLILLGVLMATGLLNKLLEVI